MPRKRNAETQAEQSERFRREAQKLIDAGELSPTEAETVMDALIRSTAGNIVRKK